MTDPIIVATRFLATQLNWISHHPAADKHLDVIERCVRRIRGVVDGPAPKRYLGPCGAGREKCPYCESDDRENREVIDEGDGPTWCDHGWHDGDDVACEGDVYGIVNGKTGTCRTCGAQVAQDERRAWLDDQVRDVAFRAAHIADAYGINVNTIRTWARDQPEVRADNGVVVRKARPAKLRAHGYDRDDKPLYLVGDVLDLARAAAIRRAENEARRERRESVEVGV